MTRKLRCYCGETRIETTMQGDSPDCIGCMHCHSTLADTKEKVKQRIPHTFMNIGTEKRCSNCFALEIDDVPQREYAMIFLKPDGVWVNNQGDEIADVLVEKYNINGRFLRDGTFDERDDIKSMIVNQ